MAHLTRMSHPVFLSGMDNMKKYKYLTVGTTRAKFARYDLEDIDDLGEQIVHDKVQQVKKICKDEKLTRSDELDLILQASQKPGLSEVVDNASTPFGCNRVLMWSLKEAGYSVDEAKELISKLIKTDAINLAQLLLVEGADDEEEDEGPKNSSEAEPKENSAKSEEPSTSKKEASAEDQEEAEELKAKAKTFKKRSSN